MDQLSGAQLSGIDSIVNGSIVGGLNFRGIDKTSENLVLVLFCQFCAFGPKGAIPPRTKQLSTRTEVSCHPVRRCVTTRTKARCHAALSCRGPGSTQKFGNRPLVVGVKCNQLTALRPSFNEGYIVQINKKYINKIK